MAAGLQRKGTETGMLSDMKIIGKREIGRLKPRCVCVCVCVLCIYIRVGVHFVCVYPLCDVWICGTRFQCSK